MGVRTLDEVPVADRAIGVRIDVNSPIAEDGSIADDARFDAHRSTLTELLDAGARVVVLAHQGRPGGDAFTTLEEHATRLTELIGHEVTYLDMIFGSEAGSAIERLDAGEALCLENVRFYSEEYMELEPTHAARTHMVDRLSQALDIYVNDAFACSHRSQATIVGFPERLPSVAGRVMERELAVLGDLGSRPGPRVAMLAGAKVDDSLRVIERLLEDELVDRVLVAGLVANAMFAAGPDGPGPSTVTDLERRGYTDTIEDASSLLSRFGDRIDLPSDVAIERTGSRVEVPIELFPLGDGEVPRDVGQSTIDTWRASIAEAGTVIVNGPVGLYEDDRFASGTEQLFASVDLAEIAIAGGGDTSAAVRYFGIDTFDHLSTGGGATLALLSGETLPGVKALEECDIDLPR